jgi:hypothetical protein
MHSFVYSAENLCISPYLAQAPLAATGRGSAARLPLFQQLPLTLSQPEELSAFPENFGIVNDHHPFHRPVSCQAFFQYNQTAEDDYQNIADPRKDSGNRV